MGGFGCWILFFKHKHLSTMSTYFKLHSSVPEDACLGTFYSNYVNKPISLHAENTPQKARSDFLVIAPRSSSVNGLPAN